MTKRLSKITKSAELLIELSEFWNYEGRLRFYVSELICCGCTINVLLQIGKCTPRGTCIPGWQSLR